MEIFETRPEADVALGDEEVVCAALLPDGAPRYFNVPATFSETEVRALAFQVRHGRPMSTAEETALMLAETRS